VICVHFASQLTAGSIGFGFAKRLNLSEGPCLNASVNWFQMHLSFSLALDGVLNPTLSANGMFAFNKFVSRSLRFSRKYREICIFSLMAVV
jgi:hypothetical protein